MMMKTRHGLIVPTTHAIKRYRDRVDPDASMAAIEQAADAARLQFTVPGWVAWERPAMAGGRAEAWLVGPGWAMPLRRHCPAEDRNVFDFAAITCFARRQLPKADRRLAREQAAEDALAA